MCWEDFITSDKSIPSRSGLYGTSLPGVTLSLFDSLTKDEQVDYSEFWDDIYSVAQANFITDVQSKLADKFHIDLKLVSRETSEFTATENTGTGMAGLQIQFTLPKYARLQVLTIEVFSLANYSSPEFELSIYDTDQNGELLYTTSAEISIGRNTIPIYQDFEVDQIYIAYNRHNYRLYQSENRYWASCNYWNWSKLSCLFPCWGSSYNASVTQVNGGGLNVDFNIYCSIEKFICKNINIFKIAFLNKIGVDLMKERILSDRFNRWTTLTTERAKELMPYFSDEYDKHLMNSVANLKIQEDEICFQCKSTVSSRNLLP